MPRTGHKGREVEDAVLWRYKPMVPEAVIHRKFV